MFDSAKTIISRCQAEYDRQKQICLNLGDGSINSRCKPECFNLESISSWCKEIVY